MKIERNFNTISDESLKSIIYAMRIQLSKMPYSTTYFKLRSKIRSYVKEQNRRNQKYYHYKWLAQ